MKNSAIFVEKIYYKNLCHGCGICSGVCPMKAIDMVLDKKGSYRPVIDHKLCTKCGICIKACSGENWPSFDDNMDSFIHDAFIGNYQRIFVGYAKDDRIRRNGASGGVATTILKYAFENNIVDAAIVVAPDTENPPYPKAMVARSFEDLLFSAKSVYSMVGLGTPLFEELYQRKERFAVVGLPCHLASLMKAQIHLKILRERCIFTIGLMEGHNVANELTPYFLSNVGVESNKLKTIRYRGTKWWSWNIVLEKKNGEKMEIPWTTSPFNMGWEAKILIPERCMMCTDFTAECADISLADAWLPEYAGNEEGYSIILIRSKIGSEIITSVQDKEKLILIESDISALHKSNYAQIDFKKRTAQARIKIYRLLGMNVPKYKDLPLVFLRFIDYLEALECILANRLSLFLSRIGCLHFVPVRLLRYYRRFKIYKFIFYPLYILTKLYNKFFPKGRVSSWLQFHFDFNWTYLDAQKISNKAPQILIGGCGYGAGNIGDEAILEGILSMLNRLNSKPKIKVLSINPDVTKRMFRDYNITTSYFWSKRKTYKDICEADYAILGGATLADDTLGLNYPIKHMVKLIILLTLFRKKFFIWAVGANPPETRMGPKLIKRFYSRAQLITTRDDVSRNNLIPMGVPENKVVSSADPAFIVEPIDDERARKLLSQRGITLDRKIVGVSVLNEKYGDRREYKKVIAQVADYLIERYHFQVVYVVHECRVGMDSEAIGETLEYMRNSARILSVEFYHPREMTGILKQFYLNIGMRMHFLILSAVAGVPFIGISRVQKVDNFLKFFGEKAAGRVDNVNFDEVVSYIESVIARYEKFQKKIYDRVVYLRNQAQISSKLFEKKMLQL